MEHQIYFDEEIIEMKRLEGELVLSHTSAVRLRMYGARGFVAWAGGVECRLV
jgi:hypothetical protein